MTVSNQQTEFNYTGNGVTVTFAYSCQVQKAGDLQVYVNGSAVTSGITKNGIGSLSGGSVTFSVAPASGAAVRLERVVVLERTTDYQQNGDFLARVVNPDFDRIWMALQQFGSGLSRALRFPKSDINPLTELPPAALRINKLLAFDAFGNPFTVAPVSGSASDVAIDLANAIAAYASPIGPSLMGFQQPQTDALFQTVDRKLRQVVCLDDTEGVDPTGLTDSTSAIQNALNNGAKHFITSANANYVISGSIVVPDGITIENTGNAVFTWNGSASQSSIGIFKSTGGTKIKMVKPIFINISGNLLLSGFNGIACSDVVLESPKAYNCKVCLFSTSSATYAGVVTSGAGANVCRDITVTDFYAVGAGPSAHGAAVDLFYCQNWRVDGGLARDIKFGVQFWGGDSNPAADGALANERKTSNGLVHGVTCKNGMAGVWGSMGIGIKITGCDVRNMSDVGIDFEGCMSCVATGGNYVAECANGNYATFFYNRNVLFSGNISQHSSEKPHYRNYNSTQNTLDKSVAFIDNTCRTDGAIGSIDCASGPVESIDVSDNTLTNVYINLAANNMRYVRIENNSLLFDVAFGTSFAAILVGGVHTTGRVRIEGNMVISQASQPAGSVGVNAQTDDANSTNYFEVCGNNVSGFPQDFILANTGSNAGIAPIFNFEGNVLGAGILNRVEQGAAVSTVYVRDNFAGNFSHWPGVVPGAGYWDKGTRIRLNTISAGGFEGSICTTAGIPGTWKTFAAITP